MKHISRPALRYFGGKWKLAPWIISHFPPHTCYVEPFGGAGSVLLRKAPSFITVYNDLSDLVVNFFKVLRENPTELIRQIELTPYSRSEYLISQQPDADPIEQARRFYVWCWQGHGRGGVSESGGWRFMKSDSRRQTPVDDWNKTRYLYDIAAVFRSVQIEHDDAIKIIDRYDTPATLFYVDPPYVHDTRGDRWAHSAYHHEYTDEQHTALADALNHIQGMAILSGYSSELYDRLYPGWQRIDSTFYAERQKKTVESIYIHPNITHRQLQLL